MALFCTSRELGRRLVGPLLTGSPWSRAACLSAAASAASAAAAPPEVAAAFERAITPEVAQHLNDHGYAVVDGIFGREVAGQLREEVVRLYESGRMHKNCTHMVQGGATSLLEKTHIHEAELTLDPAIQAAAPLCSALNSDRALATLLSLFLPRLTLESQAIKLQYNAGGGGCFPLHFDTDERLDGRRVTSIFYLNPGWTEVDGGQLRLYPFPRPPLDIPPLEDRLVLFSTARMLHRVLPSAAPARCCFTIWLSQSRRRALSSPPPPPLRPERPGTPRGPRQRPGGRGALPDAPRSKKLRGHAGVRR